MGVRTPFTASESPASPLENLEVSLVRFDGVQQLEIASTDADLFSDVYPMLCAIADRIQLDGMAALDAYEAALETWARVIAPRRRLSEDQEVGLYGELLVVEAVASTSDAFTAVKSWRGPLAEEHDFGFDDTDVEVKTTRGELRQHWISTLTQLVATQGRELWFVSVQLTRAGAGHGRTLTELVQTVEGLLDDPVQVNHYRTTLEALGWDDKQQDLYVQHWELRSAPAAMLVDISFPKITPTSLVAIGASSAEIVDVRYRIDVSARASAYPSAKPLRAALERLHVG
jgi:hypothetical protein